MSGESKGSKKVAAWLDTDESRREPGWKPTDEQFAAYKAREIELAVANLYRVQDLNLTTLHSADTIEQARKILRGREL